MNLKKVLSPDSVKIGLAGSNKKEIIANLVALLVKKNSGLDAQALIQAVQAREDQMSTGMKHGVAIPHGKLASIKELYAAIAVSAQPIDFDSLDKKPAQIFIMTLSSLTRTGPHLQFLSEVSGLLADEWRRKKILEAPDEQSLLRIFVEGNRSG